MKKEDAIKIVSELPTGFNEQTQKDKENIRAIVEEFGVAGCNIRGRCPNCWQDAVIVLRNFFGISANDTDGDGHPDTPHRYRYLRRDAMVWRGHLIDGNTDTAVIDEFIKWHPQFFERIEVNGEEAAE